MQLHAQTVQQDRLVGDHPENWMRIVGIYREFVAAGLLDDPTLDLTAWDKIGQLNWPLPKHVQRLPHEQLLKIHVREATREEITAVHTPLHWDEMLSTSSMLPHMLRGETWH